MNPARYVVLVESGPQSKLDYLERLRAKAERLVLLRNGSVRDGRNRWADELFDATDRIDTPFRNPSRMKADLRAWVSAQPGPAQRWRCLTYQEEALEATTVVARALGQPAPVVDATLVRDKVAMRKVWTSIGLTQPRYCECLTSADAVNAAAEFGDCVLKPVAMMGSLGVRRVSGGNAAEVESGFAAAACVDFVEEDLRHAFCVRPAVLVEEYIDSELELSVEGAVANGKLAVLGRVRKQTRNQIEFEEIGHETPLLLESRVWYRCTEQLETAVRAAKVNSSMIHAEFRIMKNGEPVLIELGARLAGDRIPFLIERSTGVCAFEVALHLANDGNIEEVPNYDNATPARVRRFESRSELELIQQPWRGLEPQVRFDHPRADTGFVEW